ncbi:MAG TPA: 4a-hydroxytetrahydrobiopterin dehydratase [Chloroflexota bacterium]|nr:4a-hydroxytetrahydrobiopterin dehydratase [Chloroflexota bacterium]
MKRYPLEQAELDEALQTLPGWQMQDGKLHKEYRFATFSQAMGWMMSAAIEADKMDHHPEWGNVYNRVTVDLVTHSLGNQISNLDIELARKMEALADGRKP